MKNNKLTKELRGIEKNVFRALHEQANMDFEQPFIIRKVVGHFTLKQALKTVEGVNTKNANIAIIVTRESSYWGGYLKYVMVTSPTTFENEVRGCGYARISKFYTKGDFNEQRKMEDVTAYVVAQLKSYENHREQEEGVDYNKRYKTAPYKYRYVRHDIDKSGYVKRTEELYQKAKELRKERERAKYLASDSTDKIIELDTRLEALKKEVKTRFLTAVTPEDFKKVGEALNNWTGMPRCMELVEKFKQDTANKDFRSIAERDADYNWTIDKIDRCLQDLTGDDLSLNVPF